MSADQHSLEGSKLLVVEPKLIKNRGHHHTQIAALRALLPDHQLHFIAGEGYDGFLGEAAATLTAADQVKARLYRRFRHGGFRQKVDAFFRSVSDGGIGSYPKSPFGHTILEVCERLEFDAQDTLIIPSANLDALESIIDFVSQLDKNTPQISMRLLDPTLGEHKDSRRAQRMKLVRDVIRRSEKIRLFSETRELAEYMWKQFDLPVTSGFYLTCSVSPLEPTLKAAGFYDTFRVGLLGAPRPGKGYDRVGAIVEELSSLIDSRSLDQPVEILLQGSSTDYVDGGVYSFAKHFKSKADKLRVTCFPDSLDPEVFEELFLSTDVILLPYDTGVYGLQGSGLVQDAVAAEKIIVHSQGIAMQDFLAHGNAIPVIGNREFSEAIVSAFEQKNSFRRGCRDAKDYFGQILKSHPFLGETGLSNSPVSIEN